jgi:hypothetical protein
VVSCCVCVCQIVQHQNISVNSIEEYSSSVEGVGWPTSYTKSAYGFSDAQSGKIPCTEISGLSDCGINLYIWCEQPLSDFFSSHKLIII